VTLSSPLSGTNTDKIRVYSVYTHTQEPFPHEISQLEQQLVQVKTNLYHYSPYHTRKQSVKVTLASSKIESYSKEPKPVSESGKEIKYGPYEDLPPFTAVRLHFFQEIFFRIFRNLKKKFGIFLKFF
jgi:oligosaccharyltransferase complex subunit alpha (ribophorin I)